MHNKAIFLDRDGTINIDPGYIADPNILELYPNVPEGIKTLRENFGFKIIVISNQSGITRGLMTSDDVVKVNEKINCLLLPYNTKIDDFYFCPYHPDFDSVEKCTCRKPSPKMVFEAVQKFKIDLTKSYFIGDRESDILCGKNAGLKTILLETTLKKEQIIELQNSQNSPNFISANFLDAVNFIVNNLDENNAE
jgi:D,D-heptose 1,7-bisphosphate phosphatase